MERGQTAEIPGREFQVSEVKKGTATEVSFRWSFKEHRGLIPSECMDLELREEAASTSYVWKDKVKSHTINFTTHYHWGHHFKYQRFCDRREGAVEVNAWVYDKN